MTSPEGDWILYRDDDLLAVNKPAGLPALPDGYNPAAPHVKSLLEPQFGHLWIVHRLDRDTSGVMLLALSPQAHRALNDQFQFHSTIKIYHALVIGSPDWEETVVDLPLLLDGDRRHRTVVDEKHGKPAVTGLRQLERFEGFSLVEAIPKTGRTHQIRAHLSTAGFPIACDCLYGGGQRLVYASRQQRTREDGVAQVGLLERMGLHALGLAFQHPATGSQIKIEAPYPTDFGHTLELLRQKPPPRLKLIDRQR